MQELFADKCESVEVMCLFGKAQTSPDYLLYELMNKKAPTIELWQ